VSGWRPADRAEAWIGVDVGGTKIASGRRVGGRLLDLSSVPMSSTTTDDLVAQIVAAVRALATDGTTVAAVGVGVPALVEWPSGLVRASLNVPLRSVVLGDLLAAELDLPVFVDNDATLAALAEAQGPDGEPTTGTLVLLTLGTGVGGGFVIDGKVYRGAHGMAGELGHMVVGADLATGWAAIEPGRPQPGTLERLVSGTALDALAREAGLADARDAVARAREGSPDAVRIVRLLGHRLGVAIASLINAFDPDAVVIGGGLSAASDLLLPAAIETVERFGVTGSLERTEIRVARAGEWTGVAGAALLAEGELGRRRPSGDRPPRAAS
jgi:glucokinase